MSNEVRVGIDLDTMRAMALQGVLANSLHAEIAIKQKDPAKYIAGIAFESAEAMYKMVKEND
jgi:hypothetical protein